MGPNLTLSGRPTTISSRMCDYEITGMPLSTKSHAWTVAASDSGGDDWQGYGNDGTNDLQRLRVECYQEEKVRSE